MLKSVDLCRFQKSSRDYLNSPNKCQEALIQDFAATAVCLKVCIICGKCITYAGDSSSGVVVVVQWSIITLCLLQHFSVVSIPLTVLVLVYKMHKGGDKKN